MKKKDKKEKKIDWTKVADISSWIALIASVMAFAVSIVLLLLRLTNRL